MWDFRGALNTLRGKESLIGPLLSFGVEGRPVWTPREYDKLAHEAYQKNVVAYAAINMVSRGFASVPWRLFRQGAGKTRLETHPLLNLLYRPNPMTGSAQFFEAFAAFYLIAGNSYIEVVGPEGKAPRELWNVRPDRMRVIPGPFGLPSGYSFMLKGQDRKWPSDPITGESPILHWRAFHPLNDWYGMSAIEAASFSVDQHNSAGLWNQSMLINRAQPSGALIFNPKNSKGQAAKLSDEQRATLQAKLDVKFSQANNNKPMVLEGDFTWQQMGLTARDMDWLKGRDVSARDIAVAFGVPAQLVGIPDAATFANFREARLSLWEETIIPLLWTAKTELNNWLTPMFDDNLMLDFDLDAVPALTLQRQRKFEALDKVAFLTINEKREETGFGPVDGGDEILVSATLLPLNFAMDPPAADGPKGFEYKLLTDRGRGARQREIALQQRLMAAQERPLTAALSAEIRRVSSEAVEGFVEGGQAEAMAAVDRHSDRLRFLLNAHYSATMDIFGKRILDAAKSTAPVETKDALDAFALAQQEWIAVNGAAQVVAITDTTRRAISVAVAEGAVAGEGVAAVGARIAAATGGAIVRGRAALISRTETHSAAVAAGDQAAEATGLLLRREWIATGDDRTRETHAEADGQVVGLKDPFNVGGEDLMRPGDPAGSPELTINCRCVVGHLTEDE